MRVVVTERASVLLTGFNVFQSVSAGLLRHGHIGVHFVGEEGLDAGGLRKEWYTLVAQSLMDPQSALFHEPVVGVGQYRPNPDSSGVNEMLHLEYLEFAGG